MEIFQATQAKWTRREYRHPKVSIHAGRHAERNRNNRRNNWQRVRAALVLCLGLLGFAPGAFANDWIYTVRPGDQLWKLAEAYCGTHTRWSDLAAHNQLDDPTNLRAGTRLKFPLAWLTSQPAAVELIYAKGEVRLVRADSSARATASQAAANAASTVGLGSADPEFIEGLPGAKISAGDRLTTGDSSYATVQFADKSQMRLGPESEVVFDTLTSYGDTGMVDTRVRVLRGGAESTVSPQVGPGAVYRIGTPSGVAAVRGTTFRTRAKDDTSFIEMTEGEVQFDTPTGDQVDVEAGKGLVASPEGAIVEDLLSPPSFISSGPELSPGNPLEWQPGHQF